MFIAVTRSIAAGAMRYERLYVIANTEEEAKAKLDEKYGPGLEWDVGYKLMEISPGVFFR